MNKKRFIQIFLCFGVLTAAGCSSLDASNAAANTRQDASIIVTKPETPPTNQPSAAYSTYSVDACDLSGYREPNAVVDVGYGDREYWAYTNEYGQLVKVTAAKITLQDENTEPTVNHRYCTDEASVRGTERKEYDQGHVIADSLGGVSNAYNITPQQAYLNRHGDQAYMEKVIRDAGGCTDFTAVITYPDEKTQIPSHYSYTYTVNGNTVHDEYDNVDPRDTVPAGADAQAKVYASKRGTRYHAKSDCSGMKDPECITVEEAKQRGLKPCDKCD